MSIIAVTGLPAAGKSYGVVSNIILPALKKGRHVVTNIPMTGDAFVEFPNQITQLKINDFDFGNYRHGAVVVLDEFWRMCSAGTRTSSIPEDVKSFFAEHRHHVGDDGYTTEIVLVTQDLNQVCSYVKTVIEQTHNVRKVKLKNKQYCNVDIYQGVASGNPIKAKPINTLRETFKKDNFKYYRSHMHDNGKGKGIESSVTDRNSVFKSWGVMLGIPLGLFLVFGGGYVAFQEILGVGGVDEKQVAEVSQEERKPIQFDSEYKNNLSGDVPVSDVGISVNDEQVGGIVMSTQYRIVGFGEWGINSFISVVHSSGVELSLNKRVSYDEYGQPYTDLYGERVTRTTGDFEVASNAVSDVVSNPFDSLQTLQK